MRILLAARKDLTASGTAQTNRLLRALLLAGGDIDCRLARGVLTDLTLASLARRRPPCKHEHETRRSARGLGLGGGAAPPPPRRCHEGAHTGSSAARGSLRRFAPLAPDDPARAGRARRR